MACTADRYQDELGKICVSQPGVAAKAELCWPGGFCTYFLFFVLLMVLSDVSNQKSTTVLDVG